MTTLETTIFQLILNSGNARSSAMEAIREAKEGNFENATAKIQEAKDALSEAHKQQTELIQGEARGEKTEVSVLLIHSQDHLMNAMTVKDLAEEFIDLYKKIK